MVLLDQAKRMKKKKFKLQEIKVWNSCMETITNHTCLWVVRKNLTSIMKVLLVGFGWFKSSFGVVFFDVFWVLVGNFG